jgi:hypothetical protein
VNSGTDADTADVDSIPSDNQLVFGNKDLGLIKGEIQGLKKHSAFVKRILILFLGLRGLIFGWYGRSK